MTAAKKGNVTEQGHRAEVREYRGYLQRCLVSQQLEGSSESQLHCCAREQPQHQEHILSFPGRDWAQQESSEGRGATPGVSLGSPVPRAGELLHTSSALAPCSHSSAVAIFLMPSLSFSLCTWMLFSFPSSSQTLRRVGTSLWSPEYTARHTERILLQCHKEEKECLCSFPWIPIQQNWFTCPSASAVLASVNAISD